MQREELYEILKTAAEDLGDGINFSGISNEKLLRLVYLALEKQEKDA
jgi:hypothetical protein